MVGISKRFRKENASIAFALIFISAFCLFYGFNRFFVGVVSPGNFYSPWLDQHLNYIRGFRHVLLGISAGLLEMMGYDTASTDMTLHVKGHGGIILVYSCLGFGVMSFFAAFVIAWPKPPNSKIWFLFAGLTVIQMLNITRFIVISLIGNKRVSALPLDHHDIFNIILYIVLLCIMYWWVEKTGKSITNKST